MKGGYGRAILFAIPLFLSEEDLPLGRVPSMRSIDIVNFRERLGW